MLKLMNLERFLVDLMISSDRKALYRTGEVEPAEHLLGSGSDVPVHRGAGGETVRIVVGGADALSLAAAAPANVLVFIGVEIHDPVVASGPFIMNTADQIEAAATQYRRGEMGHLSPNAD